MSRNTGVRGLTDRFCNHIGRKNGGKRIELTELHASGRRAMPFSMLSVIQTLLEWQSSQALVIEVVLWKRWRRFGFGFGVIFRKALPSAAGFPFGAFPLLAINNLEHQTESLTVPDSRQVLQTVKKEDILVCVLVDWLLWLHSGFWPCWSPYLWSYL